MSRFEVVELSSARVPAGAWKERLDANRRGVENLFRVHERLYCGGGPEGDGAFAGLQALGVKTIISVDGAAPDVERARRLGLRYVHIPLGYAGIDVTQQRLLVKAVRESERRAMSEDCHAAYRDN